MSPDRKPLASLRVVSPCPKNWEEMDGDDQRRFCTHCQKHVHNISLMPTRAVDAALEKCGGDMCIQYVAKPDGSPWTMDDAGFWYRLRYRLARGLAIAAGFAAVAFSSAQTGANATRIKVLRNSHDLAQKGQQIKGVKRVYDKLAAPHPVIAPGVLLGSTPPPQRRGQATNPGLGDVKVLIGKPCRPAPPKPALLGRPSKPPTKGPKPPR